MATNPQPTTATVPTQATNEAVLTGGNFFERNTEQRPEVVEGLIREQQLVAFAGPFGVGKSPALTDLAMHVLNGSTWCGRAVQQRQVVHFDFETPAPVYKRNCSRIARRLGVSVPRVPEDLAVYLEHDTVNETSTKELLEALAQPTLDARLALIERILVEKPNALVIIDPLELLFRVDTGKKQHILWLYGKLRTLLGKYPHAAMLITFNLRKWKSDGNRPSLLTSPREWMEEVCGTLDILNRSDVRLGMDLLGMDAYEDDVRVINGIRRGEEMHPLLIRPVNDTSDSLAGFELCPPAQPSLQAALPAKQYEYWSKLPPTFRFDDVADRIVPRASLKRLLDRAKSLGVIKQVEGEWKRVEPETPVTLAGNSLSTNVSEVSHASRTS